MPGSRFISFAAVLDELRADLVSPKAAAPPPPAPLLRPLCNSGKASSSFAAVLDGLNADLASPKLVPVFRRPAAPPPPQQQQDNVAAAASQDAVPPLQPSPESKAAAASPDAVPPPQQCPDTAFDSLPTCDAETGSTCEVEFPLKLYQVGTDRFIGRRWSGG